MLSWKNKCIIIVNVISHSDVHRRVTEIVWMLCLHTVCQYRYVPDFITTTKTHSPPILL